MPTMANIGLKKDDGVLLVFYPVDDKDGVATWRTNVSGISVQGQGRFTLQYESMKSGKVRVNCKLSLPIMEVIPSGSVNAMGIQAAPMVADEESVSTTYYFSPRGSNETRADLARMLACLVSGAGVSGGSLDPENVAADTFRDCTSAYQLPYSLVNLLFPN